MMRVGVVVSHPIQYYSPLFRELARRVHLRVFYAMKGSPRQQAAAGFGVEFAWDVDLLSGYQHTFLENVATEPSPDRFAGCDTPGLANEIRTGKFDGVIVFGWYLKCHWQAVQACRRAKVPVLVRGDSQLGTEGSALKRTAKELILRLALRRFDGFLSVGRRNREYLLHYGVSPDRIFPSPHFVDNDFFQRGAAAAADQRAVTRTRWRAGEDSIVVLFVGKFIPKKRPLDIVEAVARLTAERPEIVCVFVGAGELETTLRRRAAETVVSVHFEGFRNQSELPLIYASCDVIVLPSDRTETWGLVVNEAMACGRPAIVSDAVGCGPDLIDEGRTGFTFPLGDTDALADRVRQVRQRVRAGRDFSSAVAEKIGRYTIDAAAESVIAAIRTLNGSLNG